jgi:hypothetical protein
VLHKVVAVTITGTARARSRLSAMKSSTREAEGMFARLTRLVGYACTIIASTLLFPDRHVHERFRLSDIGIYREIPNKANCRVDMAWIFAADDHGV